MNKKIFLILVILFISALSISSVSAADDDFAALNSTIDTATDDVTLDKDYIRGDSEGNEAITINKTITINANDHVIDGAKKGPIFKIEKDAIVTINDATFKNSAEGSAILNLGTLILNNCKFVDNNANGSASAGGAVFNNGTLEATNCTFKNNSANDVGGAIFNNGKLTADKCTFEKNNINNKARSEKFYDRGGAAIYGYAGSDTTLTNSNVVNHNDYKANDKIVAAVAVYGNNTIINTTFVNNSARWGGAVFSYEDDKRTRYNSTIKGCTFTNNNAIYGGGAYLHGVDIEVSDCNFVGNNASGKGDMSPNNNNGGALCVFGNATGNIINCNFTDNVAHFGGAVKIGETDGIEIDGCTFTNNKAQGLAGAIEISSANSDYANTVTISNSKFTNNIAGSKGGAVYNNFNTTIENCEFEANTAASGGAISNDNTLTVEGSKFKANTAKSGGAIISAGKELIIKNSTFEDNSVSKYAYSMGGAISITGSKTTIEDSKFINNINNGTNGTFAFGGAIFAQSNVNLDVKNTEFTGNVADHGTNAQGGAIFVWDGNNKVTVDSSKFTDNSALNGGAIYTDGNTNLTVNKSEFTGNSAFDNVQVGSGGAIFTQGNLIVDESKFTANTATNGGAIHSAAAAGANKEVTISNSEFKANNATHNDNAKGGEGGAIIVLGDLTADVENDTFDSNVAKFEGGAIDNKVNLTVKGSTFANNKALLNSSRNDIYSHKEAGATTNTELPQINGTDLEMVYGDDNNYEVTVLDQNGNPVANKVVEFQIAGEDKVYKRTTDENGTAIIMIKRPAGEYSMISTVEDNDGNIVKNNNTITVKPNEWTVNGNDLTMIEGEGASFNATVLNAYGEIVADQKVTFQIKGEKKTYTRTTDENGMAIIQINRKPGTYTMISSVVDENGKVVKAENKIIVKPDTWSIEGADLEMVYGDHSKFNATVTNVKGEPLDSETVTFQIKGEKNAYKRTTNDQGVAEIEINRKVGTYTMISSVTMDDGQVITSTSTIVIKSNETIKAQDVSIKAGTGFNATITGADGNPVANQVVKFQIKGESKVYSRTTDENGIATININRAPGTYDMIISLENGEKITSKITVE